MERSGRCSRCGFTALSKEDWGQLIGHHKVELSESNVDNPDIALNPEQIEVICLACHNKEHHRFGHTKKVYVVWGSPLSGKNTLVRELMQHGDIVLDVDALWQAITMQGLYSKPNNCRFNVFALRDHLMDQIKTRYGQWYTAWVIGGYPDKYARDRLAASLGAELIHCDCTMQECLERRAVSGKPALWDGYIRDWWDQYARSSVDGFSVD